MAALLENIVSIPHQPVLTFPVARYRYTFRMHETLRLPFYAGSLLRGQFGASLRQLCCVTGMPSCAGCALQSTCPHPAVFEAPAPASHKLQDFSHIPNPYIVEPPAIGTRIVERGEVLQFNLVLVGRSVKHLPLISFALQRAFLKGIGDARVTGTLESIEHQHLSDDQEIIWNKIWQSDNTTFVPHDTDLSISKSVSNEKVKFVTLNFSTPLRLQNQGKPVFPDKLSPRKFVADLLRRTTLLADFHTDRPDLPVNVNDLVHYASMIDHQHNFRWQDWSRFSSRQKREMTLGGAMGSWTLFGTLDPLLPWLSIGQWLHVGKNATMGMGAYTLEVYADE